MGGPNTRKTNSRWRTAVILNNQKSAISPQTFDRLARNLARRRILAFRSGPVGITSNFKNPRWRTADILKNYKRPYLSNGLSDRHEIRHIDAYWPSEQVQLLKCSTLKNPRWRTPPTTDAAILKIAKKHVSATVRPIGTKFGLVTLSGPPNQTGS